MPPARPGFNSPKTYVTGFPDREEAPKREGRPRKLSGSARRHHPDRSVVFTVEQKLSDSVRLHLAQFGSGSSTGSSVTKTFGTVADRIIVPTAQ